MGQQLILEGAQTGRLHQEGRSRGSNAAARRPIRSCADRRKEPPVPDETSLGLREGAPQSLDRAQQDGPVHPSDAARDHGGQVLRQLWPAQQLVTTVSHESTTHQADSGQGVQLLDGRRRTEPEPKGDLESDRLPDGDQTMLDAHQLGHEFDVEAYISWWIHLFRSKQGKMEELKVYWVEAGWKLALELRQQHEFAEITRNIMEDTASLQTALTKEISRAKGAGKTTQKTAPDRRRSTRTWNQPQQSPNKWHNDRRPWTPQSSSAHSHGRTSDTTAVMTTATTKPSMARDSTGLCSPTAEHPTRRNRNHTHNTTHNRSQTSEHPGTEATETEMVSVEFLRWDRLR